MTSVLSPTRAVPLNQVTTPQTPYPPPDLMAGQGTSSEIWQLQLLDANNNPVNLTGFTNIELIVVDRYLNVVIDGVMTVLGIATAGQVQYAPTATDTASAGWFQGFVKITWPGALRTDVPDGVAKLQVRIIPKLA